MVWSAPAFEVLPRPGELTSAGRRRPTPDAGAIREGRAVKKETKKERKEKKREEDAGDL